jgi:hypothetical protein
MASPPAGIQDNAMSPELWRKISNLSAKLDRAKHEPEEALDIAAEKYGVDLEQVHDYLDKMASKGLNPHTGKPWGTGPDPDEIPIEKIKKIHDFASKWREKGLFDYTEALQRALHTNRISMGDYFYNAENYGIDLSLMDPTDDDDDYDYDDDYDPYDDIKQDPPLQRSATDIDQLAAEIKKRVAAGLDIDDLLRTLQQPATPASNPIKVPSQDPDQGTESGKGAEPPMPMITKKADDPIVMVNKDQEKQPVSDKDKLREYINMVKRSI